MNQSQRYSDKGKPICIEKTNGIFVCNNKARWSLDGIKCFYCDNHANNETMSFRYRCGKTKDNGKRCCTISSYYDDKIYLCTDHKYADMPMMDCFRCQYEENDIRCNKRAKVTGELRLCSRHKGDIKRTDRCDDVSKAGIRCGLLPSYGYNNKLTRCSTHREADMTVHTSRLCKFHDRSGLRCDVIASLGLNRRDFCSKHADPDMKQQSNPNCKQENCKSIAHFGANNSKDYCLNHKRPNMTTNSNVFCTHSDENGRCTIFSSFGIDKKRRCLNHKEDDMLPIRNDFCDYLVNGIMCGTRASYGKDGQASRCWTHREGGMERIYGICKKENCRVRASYGINGELISCYTHKEDYMEDYNSRCSSCQIKNVRTTKTIGGVDYRLCATCLYKQFPEQKLLRYKTIKQDYVFETILSNYPDHNIDFDQTIVCANNKKYRPDVLFTLDDRYIIVEIDEFQHKKYNFAEDQARSVAITKTLEATGLPVIMIRFNPDSYNNDGDKYPSMFENNNGELVANREEATKRVNELNSVIDKYMISEYIKSRSETLFFDVEWD